MFCWFLADIVCSVPLSIGTLKSYVTHILENGPKDIVKSNVKIKIAFTNFYTGIIILTFLAAGNLAKCRHQLQIFFVNWRKFYPMYSGLL